MAEIKFNLLRPDDQSAFKLIAGWYLNEWEIPVDKTIQRFQKLTTDKYLFQVIMMLDGIPVSTGGLYNHVALIDKEPRFKVYKHWLGLVYTIPEQRHKGYGALICKFIQGHSTTLGLNEMYLFTDTAEQLYKRLGWTELERLAMENRNVVVMKLDLLNDKTSL
jgi:GNAT superfamily N-acetyltransferase